MRWVELTEGDHDAEHARALRDTGFWGTAGAGCIMLARDTGRLLFAHRGPRVEQPNTWGCFGGAIDPGEDPQTACAREVREEAAYHGHFDIIPLYIFKAPSGNFRFYNFLAIVDEEFHPHLDWENQGYRWVEWGEWPTPLHFGLTALFKDRESLETMIGEVQAIRSVDGPNNNT